MKRFSPNWSCPKCGNTAWSAEYHEERFWHWWESYGEEPHFEPGHLRVKCLSCGFVQILAPADASAGRSA